VLIIFAGLPGVGKTTLARELARQRGAAHLRIDTIEQVLTDAGADADDCSDPGLGYRLAYALAADNLRLGLSVIGDSVNSLIVTREAWRRVAVAAEAAYFEVEVICSELAEHRRRVETRAIDIPGLVPPTWAEVQAREVQPWAGERIVIDTAGRSLEQSLAELNAALAHR